MFTAATSVTEMEQIIVSCHCSWLDELLTREAENTCFVSVLCSRGGYGVLRTCLLITEVAVQHLWLFPWRLYPSLVDVPLGIRVVWMPILFPPFLALISTVVPSRPPKLNRFCYFEECYSEILHMVSFIV